jgi:hypothetical protein
LVLSPHQYFPSTEWQWPKEGDGLVTFVAFDREHQDVFDELDPESLLVEAYAISGPERKGGTFVFQAGMPNVKYQLREQRYGNWGSAR